MGSIGLIGFIGWIGFIGSIGCMVGLQPGFHRDVLYAAAPVVLRGPGIARANVKIHTVGYQRVLVGLDTKKSAIIDTVAFMCSAYALAAGLMLVF